MPRDFQRSRLYDWELDYLQSATLIPYRDTNPLSVEEAWELALEVWAWCPGFKGMKLWSTPPTITYNARRTRGAFHADTWEIRLPRTGCGRSRWYILHELAHAVLHAGKFPPNHGPEFCTLYSRLLGEHTGGTLIEIQGSMQAVGLKLAATDAPEKEI